MSIQRTNRCLRCCWLWTLVVAGLLAAGCRNAPITGRRQMLLLPEAQEIALGEAAYQETLAGERPSSNSQYVQLVRRVGTRIATAADRPDYRWEFRVVDSPEKNAFCLPGGKVAVYEGIMPVCQNEAGLAVVISHEVAHALARHGGERMSQGYVVNGLGAALNYLTLNQRRDTQQRVMKAYGLVSEYGYVLPFSRTHELEADHMGLMLMARAGYDPAEAPRFWQRFAQQQGPSPPEFLSTHPADEHRAAALSALLPEAQHIYAQVATPYGQGETIVVADPSSRPLDQATPALPVSGTTLNPSPARTP